MVMEIFEVFEVFDCGSELFMYGFIGFILAMFGFILWLWFYLGSCLLW